MVPECMCVYSVGYNSIVIYFLYRALHIAARKGDFSTVIKLLKLGADPLLVNSSHHTPLQLIAIKVGGWSWFSVHQKWLCSLPSVIAFSFPRYSQNC